MTTLERLDQIGTAVRGAINGVRYVVGWSAAFIAIGRPWSWRR